MGRVTRPKFFIALMGVQLFTLARSRTHRLLDFAMRNLKVQGLPNAGIRITHQIAIRDELVLTNTEVEVGGKRPAGEFP